MSRTRRRVSRALIACLGVTLAIGLVFWLHNTSDTKAAQQAASEPQLPPPPKPSSELRAEEIKAKEAKTQSAPSAALVTQTPSVVTTPALTQTSAAPTTPAPATPTASAPKTNAAAPGNSSILSKPEPIPVSSQPIVDAPAKIDSGNMLEGRKILAAALASKSLGPADASAVKKKLAEVNQTVVFSRTFYPSDEFGGTYKVQPGDRLERIASQHDITWQLLARVNGIDPKRLQAGKTIKMVKGPFHAVVDKSDFTLDLWIGPPEEPGSMYVTTYRVGLGSADSTPTGSWIISGKLTNPAYYSPRGEGVIDADDPKNPLGEYWMSLEGIDGQAVGKTSYGIHGTIEPDSIGKQASMGCIRMLNEEAGKVYEMLVDGKSTVLVRE